MTTIQYAWAIYLLGSLGCTIAAWWMFLWAWRFIRYSAVVTVMTILFTPYAIDPQTFILAPAIYTLVFEGLGQGIDAVRPLIKLMIGIWAIGIILVAVIVLLTRKSGQPPQSGRGRQSGRNESGKSASRRKAKDYDEDYAQPQTRQSSRGLSREEYQARNELMAGEIPMRAIRD